MPLRITHRVCVACYIANILMYSASAGLGPHVLTELELSHRAGVQALTNHTWQVVQSIPTLSTLYSKPTTTEKGWADTLQITHCI